MLIEPVRDSDAGQVHEIVNHYIETTAFNLKLAPLDSTEFDHWFGSFSDASRYQMLVARSEPGTGKSILGFSSSTPFNPREGYRFSVWVSVYLQPDSTGRGLGTELYQALFAKLAQQDVHRAYAGITIPNEPSLRLHRKLGFRTVGTMHEVGHKFGTWHDVIWLEKKIAD